VAPGPVVKPHWFGVFGIPQKKVHDLGVREIKTFEKNWINQLWRPEK